MHSRYCTWISHPKLRHCRRQLGSGIGCPHNRSPLQNTRHQNLRCTHSAVDPPNSGSEPIPFRTVMSDLLCLQLLKACTQPYAKTAQIEPCAHLDFSEEFPMKRCLNFFTSNRTCNAPEVPLLWHFAPGRRHCTPPKTLAGTFQGRGILGGISPGGNPKHRSCLPPSRAVHRPRSPRSQSCTRWQASCQQRRNTNNLWNELHPPPPPLPSPPSSPAAKSMVLITRAAGLRASLTWSGMTP